MSAPVEAYHRAVALRTDYETPPDVFAKYGAGCTLDVCATYDNAQCVFYFTPEHDGLAQDWGTHRCWMNPPYGREIRKWVAKAHDAASRGATVVALIPARTDSDWWHRYIEPRRDDVTFVRGRIRFVGMKHNAPFPCCVVVFRPSPVSSAGGAGDSR